MHDPVPPARLRAVAPAGFSRPATQPTNGPTPADRKPDPAPRPRYPDWAII